MGRPLHPRSATKVRLVDGAQASQVGAETNLTCLGSGCKWLAPRDKICDAENCTFPSLIAGSLGYGRPRRPRP